MEELHDETVPVDDHLERDEEMHCGYCGKVFSSQEMRIEKIIYGKKWVFCDEDCLANFHDASNFKEDEQDHAQDDLDITVSITGPEE